MNRFAGLDEVPRSKEQADEQGAAYGKAARDLAVSVTVFEESLELIIEDWRRGACDLSWIKAGAEAARSAYHRSKPVAPDARPADVYGELSGRSSAKMALTSGGTRSR